MSDIPIVGATRMNELRSFDTWIREKFDGSVQEAVVALAIGIAPATRQDQIDFLPKIPTEIVNQALLTSLYKMVTPIYAAWELGQRELGADHGDDTSADR